MLKFTKVAAQGEIVISRLGDVPSSKADRAKFLTGTKPLALEGGRFVIGHSETGHHHILATVDGCAVGVMEKAPEGMRILKAILENPTSLDHLREHDTHDSVVLEPGVYEFRTAREFDAFQEAARASQD